MEEISRPAAAPDSLTGRMRGMEWRVTRFHGEALKPFGVNMYQAMSLIYIAWYGRSRDVNQRAIEQYLYLSNPGVSKIITYLEREGYVERATDPRDARSYLLLATEKGERFAVVLNEAILEADRGILRSLTAAERKTLLRLLEKIVDKEAESS